MARAVKPAEPRVAGQFEVSATNALHTCRASNRLHRGATGMERVRDPRTNPGTDPLPSRESSRLFRTLGPRCDELVQTIQPALDLMHRGRVGNAHVLAGSERLARHHRDEFLRQQLLRELQCILDPALEPDADVGISVERALAACEPSRRESGAAARSRNRAASYTRRASPPLNPAAPAAPRSPPSARSNSGSRSNGFAASRSRRSPTAAPARNRCAIPSSRKFSKATRRRRQSPSYPGNAAIE